jgi:hypothetical protein
MRVLLFLVMPPPHRINLRRQALATKLGLAALREQLLP